MSTFSEIDYGANPPRVDIPRNYNAAVDFIDRNVEQGRADKTAVIDDKAQYTYADLLARVNKAGNALKGLGLGVEDRIAVALLDTIDFPAVFWGAIKSGIVPVALNTLLTTKDYKYILSDSRAKALIVSEPLLEKFEPIIGDLPFLETIIVAGKEGHGHKRLDEIVDGEPEALAPAPTMSDDVAFWLYSSGSTGSPKGVQHLHRNLISTAVLYGEGVMGIKQDDVVFSAAKLFFAYGLGNGMTFPFHVGATAVLLAGRPAPDAVMKVMKEHQPTIFYGVPTLFAAILANPDFDRKAGSEKLRLCVSAGEALPEEVGNRWKDRFGVDILDGIGSTEMLHIFLSNYPDDVRYGTSGKAVPGYQLRILDESGNDVEPGEIGELVVNGPSAAMNYWNQREKSLHTFRGPWTYTGDKYTVDKDGYYHYSGRTDDMLKVSGQWVSPFEVESCLIEHEWVLEVAVIGKTDDDDLIKPKAFVVLKDGASGGDDLESELKDFVKDKLAKHKYPRWIDFVDELPKTATGKIQRFKLRQEEGEQ